MCLSPCSHTHIPFLSFPFLSFYSFPFYSDAYAHMWVVHLVLSYS